MSVNPLFHQMDVIYPKELPIKDVHAEKQALKIHGNSPFQRPSASNDKIISKLALNKTSYKPAGHCISLLGRVVCFIKGVFHWMKSLILRILGCFKRTIPSNPAVINGGALVLSGGDLSSLKLGSIVSKIKNCPQFQIHLGSKKYPVKNVFYTTDNPSRQNLKEFQDRVVNILSRASHIPFFKIQISPNTFIQINNLGYQLPSNPQALLDHTMKSLDAITLVQEQNGVLPLVPVENGLQVVEHVDARNDQLVYSIQGLSRQCPCSHCKLISNVFEAPEFTFTFGDSKVVSVKNPFSSKGKPTDEEVYQFQLALKKISYEAKGHFESSFQLEAEESLPLSVSEQHMPISGLSLLNLAKDRYVDVSQDVPTESTFPLFDSSFTSLESGRNRLLNYVEGQNTVWDQDPLELGEAIQYCVELSESEIVLTKEQKANIRLFFDKLKTVSDRVDISLYLENRINLQRILSIRLDDLLHIENPNHSQQLEINLAKGELAASFGYGIVPTAGGKNGAVFIKTFEGQPVGVFKSPKELGFFDIIERAKKIVGQARLLNNELFAQEYAEVVASDLSREFHFHEIVPEAIVAEFAGSKGAFISFLDGFQELAKVKNAFNQRDAFEKEELKKWQMVVIWNFLIANLDPHDENIFIKLDHEDKIGDIKMIDHGNSFPMSNPAWLGPRGNLGAWGHFSISKEEFLPEVKEFIKNNMSVKRFQEYFDADEKRKGFFKKSMRKLQIERVNVLIQCVANGDVATPAELAKIQTDSDYAQHLKIRG